MLWLNFNTWNSYSYKWFVWKRIFKRGYEWTPFIYLTLRKNSTNTKVTVWIDKNFESIRNILKDLYQGEWQDDS